MLKVAHLITGLEIGGTERMLLELLPEMNTSRMKHCVYCLIGHGPIGQELQNRGIPVIYLNYKGWLDLIPVSIRLLRKLKMQSPNILVTYLIHADLLGRCIAPFAGIKKVISFKRGALLQWEFLKYLDRITRRLVTRYLSVSEALKVKLVHDLHVPAEQITVIPNGIDVKRYETYAPPVAFKESLGLSADTLVIGVISKLRQGKGHIELLQTLHNLQKHPAFPKIKLLIIGDGNQREQLKKLADELQLNPVVSFLGERSDIPELLGVIDTFVLPTHFEGMSNALLEAMAAKKPIITTSIPENMELLKHNESALLVPPGNIQELTSALLRLAEDKPLRERLSIAAYQVCSTKYDISKTITSFEQVLQDLCA